MSNKMKVIVAGIGGVGGYFGGLLARAFERSAEAEIYFVARGEHLRQIRDKGLKVIHRDMEFIAKPFMATDEPKEVGIADLVIVSTKSYALDAMMKQLAPCIGKDTIVLPLLNGVDYGEKIKNILPGTRVAEGCAYIVAGIQEPGIVVISGNVQTIYYGCELMHEQELARIESLFKKAGIHAIAVNPISPVLWEKFIFISAIATATSCFNNSIGELVADAAKYQTLLSLVGEVTEIARAKGVIADPEIRNKIVNKIQAMPFEATSSLHKDFKSLKPETEVESLCGYVVSAGKNLDIPTPAFEVAYLTLKQNNYAKQNA